MAPFLQQTHVSDDVATEIYRELCDAPTYENVTAALLMSNSAFRWSIGIDWIYEHLPLFLDVIGGDVRRFVDEQVGHCDLRPLVIGYFGTTLLPAIGSQRDREYFFRKVYVQQGVPEPDIDWVYWALHSGLGTDFLSAIILERLHVCIAAPPGDELRRELERFMNDGYLKYEFAQADGDKLAHHHLDQGDRMWLVFDDTRFAVALRLCMASSIDSVMANWPAVKVKLNTSPELLGSLFDAAVGMLTSITEASLKETSWLPVPRRLLILHNLDQLPATDYTGRWWEARVPAFRLLLDVVLDAHRTGLPLGDIYDNFVTLFRLVDPTLLYREFRVFYSCADYRSKRSFGQTFGSIEEGLTTRLGEDGYLCGTAVSGVSDDGRPQARVRVDGVRYVEDLGADSYTPGQGEEVAFKRRVRSDGGDLIPVRFIPLDK